jgi:hypothetical protein
LASDGTGHGRGCQESKGGERDHYEDEALVVCIKN